MRLQREFFCFQVSFCPVKRENRAGSSRNGFGYSRSSERYPDQFPVSRLSQLREFQTSSFFNFLPSKKKFIKQIPLFDHLSVFSLDNRKMSWCEILATATLEKRKTDLGTSPRVVRLIPSRAGSLSSLYEAKTNLKAKKSLFATSKKKFRITNGLRPTHSDPKMTLLVLSTVYE